MSNEIYLVFFMVGMVSLMLGLWTGRVLLLMASTAMFGLITLQSMSGMKFSIPLLLNFDDAFILISRVLFIVSGLAMFLGFKSMGRKEMAYYG